MPRASCYRCAPTGASPRSKTSSRRCRSEPLGASASHAGAINRPFRCAAFQQVGQRLALFREGERHGVQAVTFAGRRRSVRKNMSEVAAAAGTHLLDTRHAVAAVAHPADVSLVVGAEEARPAGSGIELGARAKQRQAAEAAGVDTVLVIVEEHAAEGALRPVFEQHVPLLFAEGGDDLAALRLAGRL